MFSYHRGGPRDDAYTYVYACARVGRVLICGRAFLIQFTRGDAARRVTFPRRESRGGVGEGGGGRRRRGVISRS